MAYLGGGHWAPFGKKNFFTIGKTWKTWFPPCVNTSGQRKFGTTLFKILNTPLLIGYTRPMKCKWRIQFDWLIDEVRSFDMNPQRYNIYSFHLTQHSSTSHWFWDAWKVSSNTFVAWPLTWFVPHYHRHVPRFEGYDEIFAENVKSDATVLIPDHFHIDTRLSIDIGSMEEPAPLQLNILRITLTLTVTYYLDPSGW